MTPPCEAQGEKLALGIWAQCDHQAEYDKDRAFHKLCKPCFIKGAQVAFQSGYTAAMAQAVEVAKKVDPLKAKADWENSEDIAYMVQKLMVAALRALKP